jgi:hypothetical protein
MQVDRLPEITQQAHGSSFVVDVERYIKTKLPSAIPLNLKDRLRMAPDAAAGVIATGGSLATSRVWRVFVCCASGLSGVCARQEKC